MRLDDQYGGIFVKFTDPFHSIIFTPPTTLLPHIDCLRMRIPLTENHNPPGYEAVERCWCDLKS